jgi:hypothetical protein
VKLTRLAACGILWLVLIACMATLDALAPSGAFRVAGWLIEFYVGVFLTFQLLIESRDQAIGLSLIFSGGFVGVYNAIWQITYMLGGNTIVWPLDLWPFAIIVSPLVWYATIAFGLLLVAVGSDIVFRHRNE